MNNRVPMTTTIVLLFIALASVGVGYGLWSKTLYIDGTVNTGSVDSVFVNPFTDDDNGVDDPALDSTDVGFCDTTGGGLYGTGSCDPAASGHNVLRKDKDVGMCTVEFDPADNTGETLLITISNAYPSYYCTVFFDVKNSGSIPVKVWGLSLTGPGIEEGYVTGDWTDIAIGQQIDPEESVPGDLDLHVEQIAPQGQTFTLVGKIQLVQWNEFALVWEKCDPTVDPHPPCAMTPVVSFEGNKVIMGTLGQGDTTQNESAHGGSAMLPAAPSYDVTFDYDLCTWDSYNAVGTSPYMGTGWWDSFSVSTSDEPYWDIDLTDPLNTDPDLPGLGFLWGGNDYADGILECHSGTETVTLPSFAGGTYLNVMLDTGNDPQSNGNHPSYGTINITSIVMDP